MAFDLPRGSKIEEKSMPKRLQDKIGFQEAKKHEKVFNISPSWGPKSSQVASKNDKKTIQVRRAQNQFRQTQQQVKTASQGTPSPAHL